MNILLAYNRHTRPAQALQTVQAVECGLERHAHTVYCELKTLHAKKLQATSNNPRVLKNRTNGSQRKTNKSDCYRDGTSLLSRRSGGVLTAASPHLV